MFGRSSKLMVSTQLQESSVTFLILPVSEDLKFTETVTEKEKGRHRTTLSPANKFGSTI
jgi:hypothetical protein